MREAYSNETLIVVSAVLPRIDRMREAYSNETLIVVSAVLPRTECVKRTAMKR